MAPELEEQLAGDLPPAPGADPDASALEQRREGLRAILGDLHASEIPEALDGFHAPEIAEILDDCSSEEQLRVLRALPDDEAADIFEDLETEDQAELLQEMRPRRALAYLEELPPDERADLFGELGPEKAEPFLALLQEGDREEARHLLSYGENTAGGRMTTEFAWLSPEDTIGEALAKLRNEFKDVEMLYYFYVLDESRRLVGLLTLRHLLSQPPEVRVGDAMAPNIIAMPPEEDQEVVARELALYDFAAMPIVSAEDGRMLGIVTFDDLLDVLEDEAAEDQELFGGVSPSEDPYIDQTLWQGLKQRFPWLAMFLVLSSGSTFIMASFTDAGYTGEFFLYVIALLPMITAMAGNAATQTATLVIRAITIQDIKARHALSVLWRELKLGLTMGLALGLLAYGRAMMVSGEYGFYLGLSIAASVVIVMGVSTVTGALLPLLFKRMGLDPAVMSSPFIATIIDIVTISIYFSISVAVYGAFLAGG